MNGPLRGKQGCWTCRLRKKKCTEERPKCSTCESLSITCYGYGPRPDWMNDKEKERAIANRLKEIVKQTSRRKTTTQPPKQRHEVVRIAPKSLSGGSSSDHISSYQPSDSSLSDLRPAQGGPILDSLVPNQAASVKTGPSVTADETVLLMHFLDHVFPLQYPLYKPTVPGGGRGWILALLLRSKPFIHAALALAAHHQRTVTTAGTKHPYQPASLVQQETHLELCIKLVNQSAQNSCPKSGLGIVTAVVQLVFFELSTSNSNAWQAHLRASMNMYQRAYEKDLTSFGLEEESRTLLFENLPLSNTEPEIAGEVTNFRFLGGTMIWLDIITSITAGKTPYLLPYHIPAISPHSQTDLEGIMGCRNWVMLQIGRIATLHEHKTRAMQQGRFNEIEFKYTTSEISRDIRLCTAQDYLEGLSLSEHDSRATSYTTSDPTRLVTRLFTHMASVYLHLVAHGFQNLELLDITSSMSEATLLRTGVPTHLLPALVCPLFFIGAVAKKAEEPFFRMVFSSPPLLDPLFPRREKILPILEEVWRKRQSIPNFSWSDSLALGYGTGIVLL